MRFGAIQDTKRRKLALEERKIDVEIEERKLAAAERSKMLEVLFALANKLKQLHFSRSGAPGAVDKAYAAVQRCSSFVDPLRIHFCSTGQ